MSYYDLLTAAQADPAAADFHSLRMAYVHSEDYDPYTQPAEQVEALQTALHAGQLPEALAAVEQLLAFNYLDIEAHMAADYIHTRLDQAAQSGYHRAFAQGLIAALMATGDGRTFDSAYIVLSVREEYLLASLMRLQPTGQHLVQEGGHWFDLLDTRRRDSAETQTLYFNVDLPRGWLERHLSDDDHA